MADLELDDQKLHALAIAAIGVSPAKLSRILSGQTAVQAWEALADGVHPADPKRSMMHRATESSLESARSAWQNHPVGVHILGNDDYPQCLAGDHQAPAVLFSRGDISALDGRPRVAVVGTRRATPYGLGVAENLGAELATSGCVVISGLAQGIDAAAHTGALRSVDGAPPVAVLGAAHDAPLPQARSKLRDAVAKSGLVLSELPPGSDSERWRFALRNRIMAALAHVVVVVECHQGGGSMHTVTAALERSVEVAAVPGSVKSPASAGTNAMLVDGAHPVRDCLDIISLVELVTAGSNLAPPSVPKPNASYRGQPADPRRAPTVLAALVRKALSSDPVAFDEIVRISGLPMGQAALGLEQLEEAGMAVGEGGWWSLPRN